MKRFIILLMVLTFLLAGCKLNTHANSSTPDELFSTKQIKQIIQTPELVQIKQTITPTISITPSPETLTPTREPQSTNEIEPIATQSALIPITSTEDFSPILYWWHDRFLIIGGLTRWTVARTVSI
jgi:hypothetical protein